MPERWPSRCLNLTWYLHLMPFFKKNKSRQPSPHPVPTGIPSHIGTASSNITNIDRRSSAGSVGGGLGKPDGDPEVPSSIPDHTHFVPNTPGPSTESGSKVLNLREYDHDTIFERLTENVPGPIQSNRSERECQW